MNAIRLVFLLLTFLSLTAHGESVTANFTSAVTIPVTAANYTATGNEVDITLSFAPPTGTQLTIVNNTGLSFISGQFSNLAHGERVDVIHEGVTYSFVASYFGGTGNDLVLLWGYQAAIAWGYNIYGELGNNRSSISSVPVEVTRIGALSDKTVWSVAAGGHHSLALCSDGQIAAWGYNSNGQLGNSSTINSSVPAAVISTGALSGKTVVAVTAGYSHSLALCSDGRVVSWGLNASGQLGNSSTTSSSVPVAVTSTGALSGKTVVSIASGTGHSLALCSDGKVFAWGYNAQGQLGNNSTTNSSVPVAVSSTGALSGKTVVGVAAGVYHSLALCSDGNIFTWGYNDYGQLGNSSTINSSVPAAVTSTGALSGKTVVSVAAGKFHSLALCSDGKIVAWGYNVHGQLGNNSTTNSSVPVPMISTGALSGKTVVAVAAGEHHSLALCSDMEVFAWGDNSYGQLGNSSTTSSSVPVAVTSTGGLPSEIVSIRAGLQHSLALAATPLTDLAKLSSLSLSGGTLSPVFSSNTTSYSVDLPNSQDSIAITPVVTDPSATVTVDGSAVASGSTSQSIQLETGANVIPIVVTGKYGGAITTYSLLVTRMSADSSLSAIALGAGVLNPGFSSGVLYYTATVGATNTSVTVTPTAANSGASIKVNETTVASGSAKSVSLVVGNNTITIVVTAEDTAYTTTYNLSIFRPSNVSTLTALLLSTGALSPVFASNTTSYTTAVPNSQDSIALTPTTTEANATVAVNGSEVASGSVSQPIPLAVGANMISTVVTAQDGVATRTYTVTVTRRSADSSLAALALGSGALIPEFSSGVLSYTATVGATTTSVTVTPTPAHSGASIKVNGAAVASGTMKSVSLVVGNNTITIVVTAEDTAFTSSYTMNILRPSNVSTLSALSLSTAALTPAFASNTTSYTAAVPNSQSSITLTPTTTEPNATVTVNGAVVASGNASQSILLVVGANVISTVVTAQDGVAIRTYTVTVTRRSADSSLSALALSSGVLNPGYSPSVLSYTTTVGATPPSVTVTPTAAQQGATIRVNGSSLPSGSAQSVNLAVGYNTITIVVTAQDTAFTTTYTLSIFRPSDVCTLSALTLSTGELAPAFSSNTTSYSVSVPNAVNLLAIQPTVAQADGAVTVNGVAVASGTFSPNIPIIAGSNVIPVVVTAQDGVATQTYTLTVTRQTDLTANFNSAGSIPITAGSYSAVDKRVNLALGFAPPTGTSLTVVRNTGLNFISGRFLNLAQGQAVTMAYQQMAYRFVANYFGGTGNDLVLQWADTKAYSWGSNSLGQLGNGGASNSSLPVAVTTTGILSGRTVIAAAGGSSHSMALCADGTVAGWGNNTYGQLGDGSNDNRDTPVAVNATGILNGKTVVAIAAGFNHSLALCSDGTVAAWGMNSAGQLGNGSNTSSNLPVGVTALVGKTVVAVFAGYNHSLARCADGTVMAWGSNAYGQLGNNSTSNSNLPVNITSSGELLGRTVISLVGGSDHSMALCSDGALLAWGRNNYGQLGNDSTVNSSVPVVVDASDVLAGKAVVSIAAGGWHGVATCSDGMMAAFGRNSSGQLGNGLAIDSSVPVAVDAAGVLAGNTPLSVGGSNAHSLALCADGTLTAWGSNNNGQLGNGTTNASNTPVAVNASTLATGERFSGLATGSSASHVLTIVAQPPPQNQPYAVWQATYFPDPADQTDPTISGELATPAGDGITNLMKYALGLNPWVSGNAELPFFGSHEGYLTLTYRRNKQATDVVYTVQAGNSLAAASWATAETVVSQAAAGDHWLVTIRDNVPMAGNPKRFMSLKVER